MSPALEIWTESVVEGLAQPDSEWYRPFTTVILITHLVASDNHSNMPTATKAKAILRPLLVIAVGLAIPATLFAQQKPNFKTKPVTLVGRVETTAIFEARLINSQNFSSFVFSIESPKDNQKSTKFVLVYYDYTSDRQTLPRSFFDYSILYELRAIRDPHCDSRVTDNQEPELSQGGSSGLLSGELLPALNSPYWSKLDQRFPPWDRAAPLECYLLRPGKYRVRDKVRTVSSR